MNDRDEHRPHEVPGAEGGHPSQADGEDPDRAGQHPDPTLDGHPSQAEGEDEGDEDASANPLPDTTDENGMPLENPSG